MRFSIELTQTFSEDETDQPHSLFNEVNDGAQHLYMPIIQTSEVLINTSSSIGSDDEEEEAPHPLGFGTTRLGLYTREEDMTPTTKSIDWKSTVDMTFRKASILNALTENENMRVQQYPKIDPGRISLRNLDMTMISPHLKKPSPKDEHRGSNCTTSQVLEALFDGRSLSDGSHLNGTAMLNNAAKDSLAQLNEIRDESSDRIMEINRKIKSFQIESERLKKEMEDDAHKDFMEAVEALSIQIEQDEADAEKYANLLNKAKNSEQSESNEQNISSKEVGNSVENEDPKEPKDLKEPLKNTERIKDPEPKHAEPSKKQNPTKANNEKCHTPPDYVVRGLEQVRVLAEFRSSISAFDKSKAVSKRRLEMKKVSRGKLNTLNHSKEKVTSVAEDIYLALKSAKEDDRKVKEGGQGLPEETKGTNYFLDLIASNVITRIQAEGFNGVRGDGFPLAHAIVRLSILAKPLKLGTVIQSHMYTVCPMLIPSLPNKNVDNMSESELMESLGMAMTKNGEYETFDRFISRTENIISMAACMMCSRPSNHTLMGGNLGAVKYLERFLEQITCSPKKGGTLPVLTAPVLVSFLTIAGHMLAKKFSDELKKFLAIIDAKVMPHLDTTSTFGAPSSIRLKKLLSGGFDFFESSVPDGAIPELYSGSTSQSTVKGGQREKLGSESSRSNDQMPSVDNNPFGAAQTNVAVDNNPFGFTTKTQVNESNQRHSSNFLENSNPFGMKKSDSTSMFGVSTVSGVVKNTPNENMETSFSKEMKPMCKYFAQGNCKFGNSCRFSHGNVQGTNNNNKHEPNQIFGSNMTKSQTNASNTSKSPFGFSSMMGTNNNGSIPSPFSSATAPAPSPFGNTTAPKQSPFGNPTAPSSSPFGNANSPSSFGNATAPSPSPFGNPAAPSPLPFGNAAAPSPSPFGNTTAPSPSPFGNTTAPSPSPFGNATAPFGKNTSSPAPFGNSSAPSPFANMSTSSPFGSTKSPFGSSASTSFGGNNQNKTSVFGNQASPFTKSPFSS